MTIYYPLIKFPIFIGIFVSRETSLMFLNYLFLYFLFLFHVKHPHVSQLSPPLFPLFVSRETFPMFLNYFLLSFLFLFHVKHFIYPETMKYLKTLMPHRTTISKHKNLQKHFSHRCYSRFIRSRFSDIIQ